MKHRLLLFAIAISMFVAGAAAQQARKSTEPLSPGAIAPDFTLTGADGKKVTLSSIKQPVVLVFYRGYW